MANSGLRVEVCHAPARQGVWLRVLDLPAGATVADALRLSGFGDAFPDVDPWRAGVGIFGRRVKPDHALEEGARVEIYRPLAFDPMESRRRRAAHKARAMPAARPARTPKAAR